MVRSAVHKSAKSNRISSNSILPISNVSVSVTSCHLTLFDFAKHVSEDAMPCLFTNRHECSLSNNEGYSTLSPDGPLGCLVTVTVGPSGSQQELRRRNRSGRCRFDSKHLTLMAEDLPEKNYTNL